ncbi:MAG TPA: hypothetical protein VLW52_07710 [Opitutaceae bacterium]|nr:hypothetical protein [Opitutaceae bacterium]
MAILTLLWCLTLFAGLVFGLGLPIIAAWASPVEEKLCAAAALGVILLYLWGLLQYWLNLPLAASTVLPAAALVLMAARRRVCIPVLKDPAAQRLAGAYLVTAGWLLGFLALVRSYSGGGWALDWASHYDRARLFLAHWPADHPLFINDQLPTRPPLANVVTAAFMSLTGAGCPFFQIFTTLLDSLAFLPGWLFASRFGPRLRHAPAVFALLFMLNPSVLENGTFAWTKLVTAFLVLSGLALYGSALVEDSRRHLATAFLVIAAGLLAHYSAVPYAVALIAAYFWSCRSRWRHGAFWMDTAICALPGAALLSTWFAWALGAFGWRGTFLTNTSVAESTGHTWASFVQEKGYNLFASLVPHPLRTVDYGFIAQASRVGWIRDYCFQLYQVNLLPMFGSAGGVVLVWLLWKTWRRDRPRPPAPGRGFWAWFISCTIVLGVTAVGGIDQWGVAHACLLSLVILGLAFLSAHLADLPRWLHLIFAAGLALDFTFGVGFHFYLQNLPHPFHDTIRDGGAQLLRDFGTSTLVNLQAKLLQRCEFVGDWPINRALLIALLATLFALAVHRLFREHAPACPTQF